MSWDRDTWEPWITKRQSKTLGSQFYRQIEKSSGKAREDKIVTAALSGAIPSFILRHHKIEFSAVHKGKSHQVTIWAMPDYFSIGTDEDYLRTPMTPGSAKIIAEFLGSTLPTRKLVNEIYKAADIKLTPKTMPPGPSMVLSPTFLAHNRLIDTELKKKSLWMRKGGVVAGNKKDVVQSKLIIQQPSRVAIYGWHQGVHKPIQPLSIVHGKEYVDYSHGVRFIRKDMKIDGRWYRIDRVLRDPNLAPLISDEGVFPATSQQRIVAFLDQSQQPTGHNHQPLEPSL